MEQIRTLDALLEYGKEVGPKKISVACAEDAEVLEAVENARKAGIATAYLVGNADKIKEVADKLMDEIAPKLTGRTSGHVRVTRTRVRVGDGAEMATIEFVDDLTSSTKESKVEVPKAKAEEKPASKEQA